MVDKLPKQWKHWCKLAGLRPEGKRNRYNDWRQTWSWFSLKGKGFCWRVNCHGMFQRGDSYAEFDRWALCDIDETTMPKTEKEFLNAVRHLLKGKQNG